MMRWWMMRCGDHQQYSYPHDTTHKDNVDILDTPSSASDRTDDLFGYEQGHEHDEYEYGLTDILDDHDSVMIHDLS